MPASERQPGTDKVAPDPAASYGREKPEKEAGMGRLDNNPATPTDRPDQELGAVGNRQVPRQINAQDAESHDDRTRQAETPLNAPAPEQPDHSMLDEEPDGWDQAPEDIKVPNQKRHPRTEGKGGTP